MNRNKNIVMRALSVTLGAAVAAGSGASHVLAVSGQNVSSTAVKDENVYVNLKQDGSVDGMYVVNEYDMAEDGTIIDYGNYSSVKNLTTNDEIRIKDGKITANAPKGKFYYQGNLADMVLPWLISIRYELDGKEIGAEELAGKNGKLKIVLSIKDNPDSEDDFFEHYLVQATLTLDTEKCTNISASGATQANVGKNRQLLYNIMAGQEKEFTIRADVTDFEMSSISIQAVPMSFAVDSDMVDKSELYEKTDEIKDAAEELDDGVGELQDGGNDLKEGTAELKDGAGELKDGAGELKDGVGVLKDGAGELKDGAGELKDGAGELKSGVSDLKDGSVTLQDGIRKLGEGVGSLNQGISSADQGAGELKSGTKELKDGAKRISKNTGKLNQGAEQLRKGAEEAMVGASQLNQGIQEAKVGSGQLLDGMNQAASGSMAVSQGLDELTGGLGAVESGAKELETALDTLYEKSPELTEGSEQIMNAMKQIQSSLVIITTGAGLMEDTAENAGENLSQMEQLIQSSEGILELADGVQRGTQATLDILEGMQDQYEDIDTQKGLNESTAQALESMAGTAQSMYNNLSPDLLAALRLMVPGIDIEASIQSLYQGAAVLRDNNDTLDSLTGGIDNAQNAADETKQTASQLATTYESFHGEIQKLPVILKEMMTEQVSQLGSAIDTLIAEYEKLDQGISAYTEGVGEIRKGYGTLYDGFCQVSEKTGELSDGASAVAKGNGQLLEAGSALKSGTETLAQGSSSLENGLEELYGGSTELASGTGALKEGTDALSAGADGLYGGITELKKGTGSLASGGQQLGSGLNMLGQGAGELADGTSELYDGAEDLSDGISELYDGAADLSSGTSELYDGAADLFDGTSELYDGAVELDDGVSDLEEGIGELKDGTEEFREETADIEDQIDEEIDKVIDDLAGADFTPVSFVSEKNTDIGLVQFVMTTNGITIEEPETEEPEPETKSILDKIKELF